MPRMNSKQYVPAFWTPMMIEANGQYVSCNFGSDEDVADDAPLCIIPTQARDAVEDPVSVLEKPNVMTHWLDLLTAAGAKILLMHGHFFDSLSEMSGGLEAGIDGFEMWQRRVDLVIDAVIERGLVAPGRIVFMGSSRHGFAVLYGTARNEKIDAAVVIGPVIHWPWLKEFEGMDDHPLIRKHDLYDLIDRLPPRPVQVQQGYADVRIGQHHNERLASMLTEAYESRGMADRLALTPMEIPGHSGGPPMHVNRTVVTFLRRQGFLKAPPLCISPPSNGGEIIVVERGRDVSSRPSNGGETIES